LCVGILLLIGACSVEKHYRSLSFFFDGVPNPELIRQQAISDSLEAIADENEVIAEIGKSDFILHPPYKERKCDHCHNQGQMGSLNESMPQLCTQCHPNLGMQSTFTHGPARGGYCTQCHHPHKAKEEKLLLQSGRELCLNCHDVNSLFAGDFHDSGDESDCISCHNPHGSENHSLLQQGACASCHGIFNAQYAVLHGPVASNNCSACHVPHRIGTKGLLVRKGRELCLNCHDASDVLKKVYHLDMLDSGVASCTDCHNPHGGDDKYMFY